MDHLTKRQFSTENFGMEKQISMTLPPHTVSTHRKNIGQKLELKTITDWERFANAFEL
jgi:DNA-binding NarL/FixJ family response regulator